MTQAVLFLQGAIEPNAIAYYHAAIGIGGGVSRVNGKGESITKVPLHGACYEGFPTGFNHPASILVDDVETETTLPVYRIDPAVRWQRMHVTEGFPPTGWLEVSYIERPDEVCRENADDDDVPELDSLYVRAIEATNRCDET